MKHIYTVLFVLVIFSFQGMSQDCDSVIVTFTTHPTSGGPLAIEWDVEDQCLDEYIEEGTWNFTETDTVFTYYACLDSGEYRARAKADGFSFEPGMFEIAVTLNGDTLEQTNEIEFGDDDLRYKFTLHQECEEVIFNHVPEFIQSIQARPVPAHDYMELELGHFVSGTIIEIYSSAGQLIRQLTATSNKMLLDCGQWPVGNYVVVCKSDNYNSIIAALEVSRQ